MGKLSGKKQAFANYKCLVICLSKDKLQFRKAKGQRFGTVFWSSYSNPEFNTLVKTILRVLSFKFSQKGLLHR